jgi:hypothetical protein
VGDPITHSFIIHFTDEAGARKSLEVQVLLLIYIYIYIYTQMYVYK